MATVTADHGPHDLRKKSAPVCPSVILHHFHSRWLVLCSWSMNKNYFSTSVCIGPLGNAAFIFLGGIRKLGATLHINSVMFWWNAMVRWHPIFWPFKEFELNVVGSGWSKCGTGRCCCCLHWFYSTIFGIGLNQICDRNPEIAGSVGRWLLNKKYMVCPQRLVHLSMTCKIFRDLFHFGPCTSARTLDAPTAVIWNMPILYRYIDSSKHI